jgi:hypothetical protein
VNQHANNQQEGVANPAPSNDPISALSNLPESEKVKVLDYLQTAFNLQKQ